MGAGWRGTPYLSRCAVRCARGRVLAGAVRGVFGDRLARCAVGVVGCARHFVARGVVSSLARLSRTTQRRLLRAGYGKRAGALLGGNTPARRLGG